jgi:hypothetical protein
MSLLEAGKNAEVVTERTMKISELMVGEGSYFIDSYLRSGSVRGAWPAEYLFEHFKNKIDFDVQPDDIQDLLDDPVMMLDKVADYRTAYSDSRCYEAIGLWLSVLIAAVPEGSEADPAIIELTLPPAFNLPEQQIPLIGQYLSGWRELRITGRPGDYLGARMKSGTIKVVGDVGRKVGVKMAGGSIDISGNAGAMGGFEMQGGSLEIAGSSGEGLGRGMEGGLIRNKGSATDTVGAGMKGGKLIVEGNVGIQLGVHMIGGQLTVEQNAGSSAGYSQHGGEILVRGNVGGHAGHGITSGTLIIEGKYGSLDDPAPGGDGNVIVGTGKDRKYIVYSGYRQSGF